MSQELTTSVIPPADRDRIAKDLELVANAEREREAHRQTDLLTELAHAVRELTTEVGRLRFELKAQSMALGRIAAQLDPLFIIPEDHPLRRDDSNKIAEAVIRKLKSEYTASNPNTPPGTVR